MIACSSIEDENKTSANNTSKVLWLQYLFLDLQITPTSMSMIWCDNPGVIYFYVNLIFHPRTK